MEISEDFIRQGPNTLGDLHNSADNSQPHSIIAKYALFGGGGVGKGRKLGGVKEGLIY